MSKTLAGGEMWIFKKWDQWFFPDTTFVINLKFKPKVNVMVKTKINVTEWIYMPTIFFHLH